MSRDDKIKHDLLISRLFFSLEIEILIHGDERKIGYNTNTRIVIINNFDIRKVVPIVRRMVDEALAETFNCTYTIRTAYRLYITRLYTYICRCRSDYRCTDRQLAMKIGSTRRKGVTRKKPRLIWCLDKDREQVRPTLLHKRIRQRNTVRPIGRAQLGSNYLW
jgi:hypothetical protein